MPFFNPIFHILHYSTTSLKRRLNNYRNLLNFIIYLDFFILVEYARFFRAYSKSTDVYNGYI